MNALEAQYIAHRIKTGALIVQPESGTHRAGGKNPAVQRMMGQRNLLRPGGERERVAADNLPAAQSRKADLPILARAAYGHAGR